MTSNIDAARERYRFAKLALFNIRLLHTLQGDASEEVRAVVGAEAKANGFGDIPPLLNQGTFLQFAYICVVWMWESAKQAGLEQSLLSEFPAAAARKGVHLPSADRIVGPRALNDWRAVLRLLRNALSHGSVEASDDFFVFSDQNKYGRASEACPTRLQLTWVEVGGLSEACIHGLTPALWPRAG